MKIHRNTMNDIEQDILHDAYDVLFILMAFDRCDGIGQDAVHGSGLILQILHQKSSPWRLALGQRLHQDFHQFVVQFLFIIHFYCVL